MGALPFNFPFDPGFDSVPHGGGSHQKLAVLRRVGITGQDVEQLRDIRSDLLIAGEESEVAVDTSGHRVVVPGSRVHISPDTSGFPADDQQQFAVSLEPGESVDDVHAGLLQLAGPPEVVLLVEASFQFDQHRHLAAVLASLEQRVDYG